MLILAADTSDKHGSVALCRGDAASFEVLGQTSLEGGTYSARLVPSIAELLLQTGFSKAQIEGFVVVDGPGSFTGLRVGLATVKALCEVLKKPLATVSMLEALAIASGSDGEQVTVVLDAGRGEAYLGEYRTAHQRVEMLRQAIVKLNEYVAQLPSPRSRLMTTSEKIVQALGHGAGLVEPLHADAIAHIGLRKLLAGETTNPAMLDANYIRRSDAELFSLPKH